MPPSPPPCPPILGVTFDFGQTLAELDGAMVVRRAAERGVVVDEGAVERALPIAWAAYDAAIRRGLGGHPWKLLVRTLLTTAGVAAVPADELTDWFWTEQPAKNLWRRPIAGMIGVVDAVRAAGLAVGIVSNSEGRLAELAEELGWRARFAVIADSGVLGIEKPDPAIFHWTAERLGVPADRLAHVGDSHAADVDGALAAGARAVWFRGDPNAPSRPGVAVAADAAAVTAALTAWGMP